MTEQRDVKWGELGLITYLRTYSREKKDGTKESFSDTVERELYGIDKQLKLKLNDDEKEYYRDMRHNMKGSVAGRFMWQLGTKTVDQLGLPSLQNCFSVDTEFITDEGIKSFTNFNDGDTVTIRGKKGWKQATIKNFGKSPLLELTLTRGRREEVIKTTPNHRWILKDGSIVTTEDLSVGSKLKKMESRLDLSTLRMCPIGKQHGVVYGDGHKISNGSSTALSKVGDSIGEVCEFFEETEADMISGLPYYFKDLPDLKRVNNHYLYGFLSGWFAADGSIATNGSNITLANKSKEVLEWARGAFYKLGITTSSVNISRELSPFDGAIKPLYRITIDREYLPKNFFLLNKHKVRFKEDFKEWDWKVANISNIVSETEDVWCVVEPENEEFTLSCGVLTKNCAFVVIDDPIRPFTWAMDMLMLGSGVGYSIKKEHVYKLPKVSKKKVKIERFDDKQADFIVPDTREGWVKLLGKVLKAHFYSGESFTYSTQLIRGQGEPIKGFGGVASGAAILVEGMELISEILNNRRGRQLRPIDCLDIMNIIGMIVVAGNVRRSAQIAIGDYDDLEFLKAKRWDLGTIPKWRGMSNNSVDVDDAKKLPQEFWDTYAQGEPYGLVNIDLSRKIGRTGDYQYPDPDVQGFNPCAEQSLANYETCCLAEIYLPNIESIEELKKVARMLYRVNKHSLALKCHHQETQDIVNANMRMGIGITGVMMSTDEQLSWLGEVYDYLRAYDKEYSEIMGFPESIKLTTVKPSGTLSLLAGVTAGVHPATAGRFYIRRIRMSADSPLIAVCESHGYHTEYAENIDGSIDRSTKVVEFPCSYPEGVVSAEDMTVFQQLDTVKFMQKNWSDNAVSVTAYYNKEDLPQLKEYIEENFNENFKTLSFLLKGGASGFRQKPYEDISEEQYNYIASRVKPITSAEVNEDDMEMLGECGIGGCPIK